MVANKRTVTKRKSVKKACLSTDIIDDIEDVANNVQLFHEQYKLLKEYREKNITEKEEARFASFLGEDEPNTNEKDKQFRTLLTLMIGSQIKDEMVEKVINKIKDADALSASAIYNMKEDDIAELIYPVAFFKRKAGFLKRTCKILLEKHNGGTPNNVKDLCALPGVGPKMAYLQMLAAFNQVVGIGVDTHIHRMSNLLKWIKTRKPEETRIQLEKIVPKEEWKDFNFVMVGFGRTVCKPVGPKCSICPIKDSCAFFKEKKQDNDEENDEKPAKNGRKSKKSLKRKSKKQIVDSSDEDYESEEEDESEESEDDN